MLVEKYVFVLIIAVLPDKIHDNFTSYKEKRKEQWYNNDTIVGEIRFNLDALKNKGEG